MTHSPPPAVAVLDDDADLALSVARLLKRHGHKAEAFSTPDALFAAHASSLFGCVVSDIQMGEIDGFAFAEDLRLQDPCVALVFMTAWPTTAHAVDAVRRHGGLDYLEKPIDEPRLATAVAESRLVHTPAPHPCRELKPHAAGARSLRIARTRPLQQGDRRAPRYLGPHRRGSPSGDRRQDPHQWPCAARRPEQRRGLSMPPIIYWISKAR